jgi:hypothetical protein
MEIRVRANHPVQIKNTARNMAVEGVGKSSPWVKVAIGLNSNGAG